MKIVLRDGPLNGQTVTLAVEDIQYSTRHAGQRVVYKDSGGKDPATGVPVFTFQTKPDQPVPTEGVPDA